MRALRIGIDSYSYHRLLGEIRPGEDAPRRRFETSDVLAHALALGVDAVSLETSFLDLRREVPAELEVVLAWGHPHGLEFGRNDDALRDLLGWLDVAKDLGARLVRCVAGSPRVRGAPAEVLRPLHAAAGRARELGLTLALENHGDLRAIELVELLEQVDGLAVCFDTANAVRVGDDPHDAALLLSPWTRMVHLKDVEPLDRVADPVAGPCSVPYGEGVVPVRDVLGALPPDALVCVELGQLGPGTHELELVEQCVEWLRHYASSNG
jgi:sugar phosphate isomerase/epimerase